MNVLLVSHGSALGGSPISLLNIAEHKINQTIRYHFAFGERGPIVERAQHLSDSVHIVPHNRTLFGIQSIMKFLWLILLHRIDIVHLNTFTSYYKYPAIAAKLAGRKVIWFVRENPEDKRCIRLKHYANLLAHKVVTVSYDTAQHMGYIRKELLTTIHNGVDIKYFSPELHFLNLEEIDMPYILNISSLEPRKGVLDLIKSYANSNIRNKYKLVLLGEDRTHSKNYLYKLMEAISLYQLDDRVIFISPKQDVRPYIAQCIFVVLISYWEGLSRVLLEAAAMGKPILASRNGGNKEVVENAINGLLVEAGDLDGISSALDQMSFHSDLEAMIKKSRALATNLFDIRQNTQKIEGLYNTLT